MKKRFVAATFIAVAMLFSQGGNYILAALCPHSRSTQSTCEIRPEHAVATHHGTHQVEAEKDLETGDAFEVTSQKRACTHCAVHSSTRRNERALQQSSLSQRSQDELIAGIISEVPPTSVLRTAAWTAKAHGPPVDNVPLHLLIKVFRI